MTSDQKILFNTMTNLYNETEKLQRIFVFSADLPQDEREMISHELNEKMKQYKDAVYRFHMYDPFSV